ncbi:MAG: NADH-quinone oxidoreductase subunit J [Bradyrhizobiaceae bacterium]|nr:NADH-quinone oxidoreductase subunit J [Bradyrhizobiaceae bacterium]
MSDFNIQVLLFAIFAIGAVATALLTITRRNPVSSAMNLVAHFFMLSGLYLTLHAQFVAAVQVLVYAGAIMVLVVFVIMLLNLGREQQAAETGSMLRNVTGAAIALVFVLMLTLTFVGKPTGLNVLPQKAIEIGTVESIGQSLFTEYLFPFEAVSLLLLAALIGAVVIARRHNPS